MNKTYTIVDVICEIILMLMFISIGYYISIVIYSRNILYGTAFIVFYGLLILLSINFKVLKLKSIRRK
jgi:hypothetical protein